MAVRNSKQKLLLCAINTKYIHSNLAVYLLEAYAKTHAPGQMPLLETAEFTINNRAEEVLAAIYEKQPSAVFFSCYIWNREYILDLIADLHKILPDTDIWMGGPEVTFDPEETMEQVEAVAGILLGEGEETFLELVRDYYGSKAKSLEEIPGICYRDPEGSLKRTAPRPLLNMDDLPFLYEQEKLGRFEHKILYYESSRGCPFGCSYCLSSVDKKVRLRSLEKVLPELGIFLKEKVPQVKFVDRTFNVNRKRSAAILTYLLEQDNGITNFHFEIAGDLLSDEELSVMEQMRPGLIQLEIGVQSVNEQTLKAIHRTCDFHRLKQVVDRIRSRKNIHIHLDLIAGLPYEDYSSFRHSFDEVYGMKPTQLQLGFLKVLKGSPMEQDAKAYGIVYKKKAPYEVLFTNWISYAQLVRLKEIEEMVELYYNSRQFTGTLQVLEQEFASPFMMYESLAGFYKEKGYFTNSPARLYRYQVLLDFIRQYTDGEKEELYRELLTYDLYLREHVKSRPDFAADLKPYKERLHQLRLEKTRHAEIFHYPVYKDIPLEICRRQQPFIMIFDYDHRDPLDHNAAIQIENYEEKG